MLYKNLILFVSLVAFGAAQAQQFPTTEWDEVANLDWYDPDAAELEITTAEELAGISVLVEGGNTFQGQTIQLLSDLNLGEHLWIPIGKNNDIVFKGTFEGNDHIITDLKINRSSYDFVGLFGFTLGATIKNLHFVDPIVYGMHSVGVVAGNFSTGGLIENCTVTNGYVQCEPGWDGNIAGGIAGGLVTNSTVKHSSFTGEVHGGNQIGGLVGTAWNGSLIEACFSEGLVMGGDMVGGLVGNTTFSFPPNPAILNSVKNSYSRSSVVAAGGRAGGLYGSPETTARIANTYATGTVQGLEHVGGLAGYSQGDSEILNSFWDTESSGLDLGLGYNGSSATIEITGKTTEEMTAQEMVDLLNAGQDAVWTIIPEENDGYPVIADMFLAVHTPAAQAINFVVYPSVTADALNIRTSEQGHYRIINTIGAVQASGEIAAETQLSVAHLAAGAYIVILETSKGKSYQRFIKR